MNTTQTTTLTKTQIKTLRLRLKAQRLELADCTTPAMEKCVIESIDDTLRQLGEQA